MAGMAITLGALRWFVEETDAELDATAVRQLQVLGFQRHSPAC